jgi:preprotein translocase subunit SecF
MAIAALVALVHDLTITVGVYALVGFEVTPGTVIGLLTILGYSLYDTVVVFDGLKESSKGITKQSRYTYSEIANRSLNSTLVRSINTTVVALLPVAALLFFGGGLLGAGMLNDISLALFVGLAAGAYSSIFIATPLVADLKERDPQMKALTKRVRAKRAAAAAKGESATGPEDEEGLEEALEDDVMDEDEAAAAGVVGQRRQPSTRNRGRGRPSGKRR